MDRGRCQGRVSRRVSRAHVIEGTKLQIGLDLSHGGVCLRCILVIIRFHTLALSTSLLVNRAPVYHTYQHTSLHRRIPSAQHGSSQTYHQGDRASHGRAVCLSIPDYHNHVLTRCDSVPGIEAIPHEDNLRYFDVKIHGPSQSPYEGT